MTLDLDTFCAMLLIASLALFAWAVDENWRIFP